jgi:hypothetical protein
VDLRLNGGCTSESRNRYRCNSPGGSLSGLIEINGRRERSVSRIAHSDSYCVAACSQPAAGFSPQQAGWRPAETSTTQVELYITSCPPRILHLLGTPPTDLGQQGRDQSFIQALDSRADTPHARACYVSRGMHSVRSHSQNYPSCSARDRFFQGISGGVDLYYRARCHKPTSTSICNRYDPT